MLPNPHGGSVLLKRGPQRCPLHSAFICVEMIFHFPWQSLSFSLTGDGRQNARAVQFWLQAKWHLFCYESALVTEHHPSHTVIIFSLSFLVTLSLKLFDPDRHFLPTPKLHALESCWVNYTVHLRPRNICQYHCYLVQHGFIFLLPVALQRRVACNLLHAAKSTSLKWFKCALLAFLCLLRIMSSTKMVST